MNEWRLLTDDKASASFGLAADEYMARRVGEGLSPPSLRLYTYRSHCALVGRHQNVAAEIDRDFCQAHGICINRRPTGGGSIIMGEDQLGIALPLLLPSLSAARHRVRALFADFAEGVIAGLAELGVPARFGGKNDVEVGRRKIAGLGLYHDHSGGLLFHASVLVDLDIALMLKVLRTPFEKISDKGIAAIDHRVTTIRREMNCSVSVDQARKAIGEGFARQFRIELMPSYFTDEELEAISRLEAQKYLTNEWIDAEREILDASGSARVKTPGGLLSADVALAGDVVKSVYITGDFFAEAECVSELERRLRWTSARPLDVFATVDTLFAENPDAWYSITASDLALVVNHAVEDARRKLAIPETYGCFVNP